VIFQHIFSRTAVQSAIRFDATPNLCKLILAHREYNYCQKYGDMLHITQVYQGQF